MDHAPGPYYECLSEVSEFLSSLVLKEIIIIGSFHIHVYVDYDSFNIVFTSLLDSIGFCQSVHRACGIEIEHLILSSQNPLLSEHHLIIFEFLLQNTCH